MRRVSFVILLFTVANFVQAKPPSRVAIISCLSAQTMSVSVKWLPLPSQHIYAEDNYKDGFHAVYYVRRRGIQVGYAERGEIKAVLYGHQLFPISKAQALPGFATSPSELDPFSADWATVTDSNGTYLCVSFPFGDLGQSGSFQKNRSAYLLAVDSAKRPRILYSATGNLDVLQADCRASTSGGTQAASGAPEVLKRVSPASAGNTPIINH